MPPPNPAAKQAADKNCSKGAVGATKKECPVEPSVKIKNAAATADGCKLVPKGKTHKYRAVGDPAGGTFRWTVPSKVSVVGSKTDAVIEIKGETVSSAMEDSPLSVEYTWNGKKTSDTIKLTVFEVKQIEAKLKGTPCYRNKSRANTMPAKTSTKDSKAFDATSIALVRGCGDLKLQATVAPAGVPIAWQVERAADDAAGLTGLPTHSEDGASHKRVLNTNATGSFHVTAFVDCNGNNKRDADEGGIILNIVLVNIEIPAGAANNRILKDDTLFNNTRSDASNLIVDSGSTGGTAPGVNDAYTDAEFTKHPLAMKVTVKLTSGGADQRRSLDKIGLGYIQQTTGDSVQGTYADGRTVKEVIAKDPGLSYYLTSGTPDMLAFPVRDTREAINSGTGPFIISSSDNDKTAVATGGQTRVVRFVDPPAIALPLAHPVTSSDLVAISGSNDFEAFLSAYSTDFNENYTVIASAAWSVKYGAYTAAGGWTNAGASITAAAATTAYTPPSKGESTTVERCPPNFVDNLKMDAR